jgi:hypothetical protein
MMTPADNELLTKVGLGTKMGELLRRYWHPIAASDEMTPRPTKAVRILGETLVLFRDARVFRRPAAVEIADRPRRRKFFSAANTLT